MRLETFFENFEQIAETPNGVAKMRELVLQLAVQGKLVEQESNDESAKILFEHIQKTKTRLINERTIKRQDTELILDDEPSFSIPSSWVWTRLGEIGDWGSGSTPSRGNYELYGGGIMWLKSGELNDNQALASSEETVSELALETGSFRRNQPGDVLLAMYGATIGKVAILVKPAVTNQAVCGCTPFEGVLNRYLFNYLVSQRANFHSASEGGAQPNISKVKIVSFPFPLPPLAEQKRIVAKVDELMVLCDQLEAQQQERDRRHAALARASLARFADAPTAANLQLLFQDSFTIPPADLRKAILTLAVQGKLVPQDPNDEPAFEQKGDGFLSDHPPNWCSGTVFDLAVLKSGNSFPSEMELEDGEYLYVKVSDMNLPENQHEITTSSHFITPDQNALKSLIPSGSIIFPKRGGAIATNKKRLVRRPLFVDTNTMAMTCPPFIELRYLHIWFLGIDLWELNSGTSVPQINNKDIGPLLVPVPPIPEQRRIVAKVDQLMVLVDLLEAQLIASRATAEKLMEAVVMELIAQD